MILYPEIALKHGRSVTVGAYGSTLCAVHEDDPADRALALAEAGAERLHVVDLDAAAGSGRDNLALIRRIIARSPVPVQVSGGARCLGAVDRWIDWGAECVVLGDGAAPDPEFVLQCCARHPFRVAVAADIAGGRVLADRRGDGEMLSPLRYARAFDRADVAGLILTDAEFDPDFPEASFALVAAVARNLATPVIAAGMVRALDDLVTLEAAGAVAGAIVGTPLQRGAFSLGEAMAMAGAAGPHKVWWLRARPAVG